MITEFFRCEEHVPDVYVNESRDMQVLLRLLSFAVSATKYSAEDVYFANNPMLANDNLISLLCTKAGFFNSGFEASKLRVILTSFMSLVRRKGTEKAIIQAVYLFFKSMQITTQAYININNKNSISEEENYTVNIGLEGDSFETKLLEEILQYILPTGYILNIFFSTNKNYTEKYFNDFSNYYVANKTGVYRNELYDSAETDKENISSLSSMIIGSDQ